MAARPLTRSKTVTLNRSFLLSQSSQSLRPLHWFTSPLDPGAHQPSNPSPSSTFIPKSNIAAASVSPAVSSIIGSNKILGFENTLPRWFSANAQGKLTPEVSPAAEKKEMQDVTSFSPLETISIKPRASSLGNESSKIKRTELSQKVTYALIPAILLLSSSPLTTSLLVLSVYWQVYGFFKEIFLDYVHQEVTRNWVLVYFKVLLLILVKDTFLNFGLV